jgi:hypothetical protein
VIISAAAVLFVALVDIVEEGEKEGQEVVAFPTGSETSRDGVPSRVVAVLVAIYDMPEICC